MRVLGRFLAGVMLCMPLMMWGEEFELGMEEYKKGEFQNALMLFDESCQNGNKQGCYNLAVMYKHGQGIRPSRQKSQELFSKACQNDTKECRFSELNL